MFLTEIPFSLFVNLVAPLVAAQTFVIVLIYFTLVRRRIAAVYQYYAVFLGAFIFFLVGRPIQEFSIPSVEFWTLYARMMVMFGVGIPSLLVASRIQTGSQNLRLWLFYSYGTGCLIALLYVATADAVLTQHLFTPALLETLGLPTTVSTCRGIQIAGSVLLLVLPCGALLLKRLPDWQPANSNIFLFSGFLYGLLFAVGSMPPMHPEMLYIGSVICGGLWAWAVFRDIRDMTGKVGLLKDELQFLIRTGKKTVTPTLKKRLDELEMVSEGNLEVYKMRVHEILLGLTDVTIQAGADTQALVRRHTERMQQIEAIADPRTVRHLFEKEARELSEIISNLPKQNLSPLVAKAKAFVQANYNQDLNVDLIAKELGVSRSHFMRLFKKETGQTVNQYLTDVRVEQAKQLLAKKSVTDTAFEVGFNDSNYFSTVFKKQTGVSPAQFRKSL